MQIRDNVRRRRQERIVQLLGRRPDDPPEAGRRESPDSFGRTSYKLEDRLNDKPAIADPVLSSVPSPSSANAPATVPAPPLAPAPVPTASADPDPELWWKQQQKRLKRAQPMWQGASGLANPPAAPAQPAPPGKSALSRLAAGLAIRTVVAALLFGAAYSWFQSDWPGSGTAREWSANAVTQDMDFQAVEAWYEQHFGGSPSFLPVFRNGGKAEAQAVSGTWKRSEAVPPARGRIVQTFKQDGDGIRIAAEAGSDVLAAYEGRVMSVAVDNDGRATILIRHAGKTVTTYGNVAQPTVRADDWVQAGQRLGVVPSPMDAGGESLLIFSVTQDDQAVDPAEVVPFD